MDSTGSWSLAVLSWVWLLLQLVFGALSAQHYLLYKDAAQRQCHHDALDNRRRQHQKKH